MKFVQISERDKIRENLFWNVRKNWYREKGKNLINMYVYRVYPFIINSNRTEQRKFLLSINQFQDEV